MTHAPERSLYGPERWAELCERVLARTWHCVATREEVSAPGTVLPVTLLPGALDEPVLLVRDEVGALRAFTNACTHRGAPLASEPCRVAALRCPYHGRRFGLDGTFRGAPGFEAGDALHPVPVAEWGPLVFVALDPAMPAPAPPAGFERLVEGGLVRDPHGEACYAIAAHWLLWCENYLEGLHIPFVHPALNRALDWRGYRTEIVGWDSLQVGPAAPGTPAFPDGAGGHYLALFPTTMVNAYPWGLSINIVEPVSPVATRIRYQAWVARPELRHLGAGAGLDDVEREDDAIVELVQRGVRARGYRPGAYAAGWEAGVLHFHQRIAVLLAQGGAP